MSDMEPHSVRPRDDQNLWNIAFSALFALLLALSVFAVYRTYGFFPTRIPPYDFLLISLAIFRIVRLVSYDRITRWLREGFLKVRRGPGEDGEVLEARYPYKTGPLRTIHDLLECPWCTGVWAGLVVVFCYFMVPFAWYVILVLAVSAVGSFFQLLSNMVGWRAENLKIDAKGKGAQ